MRLRHILAALAILFAPLAAQPALAQLRVSRGDEQPMPVAVPAFGGTQGAEIAQVISANLQRSGLFRPLDPASFLERDLSAAIQPRFDSWKQINASALVNGTATMQGGQLRVDFRLWDVYNGQQLLGLQFTSSPENWRRVAHKISDAVYERLTGEKGYFDTRVVFVAETGGRGGKTKRLAIMDQDGANPSYLTELTGWAGFAICTWSLAGVFVLVVSLGNLVPRAFATQKWYRERFPDYPRERKVLIPYLL